jgi:hypothetical protein
MRCNLHVVKLYKFIGIELILAKIEMFDLWKTRMTTNLKKGGITRIHVVLPIQLHTPRIASGHEHMREASAHHYSIITRWSLHQASKPRGFSKKLKKRKEKRLLQSPKAIEQTCAWCA